MLAALLAGYALCCLGGGGLGENEFFFFFFFMCVSLRVLFSTVLKLNDFMVEATGKIRVAGGQSEFIFRSGFCCSVLDAGRGGAGGGLGRKQGHVLHYGPFFLYFSSPQPANDINQGCKEDLYSAVWG